MIDLNKIIFYSALTTSCIPSGCRFARWP